MTSYIFLYLFYYLKGDFRWKITQMFTFTASKASMSGTGSTSTLSISSIFVRRSANMVPRSIKSIKSIKKHFEHLWKSRRKALEDVSSELFGARNPLEIRWTSARRAADEAALAIRHAGEQTLSRLYPALVVTSQKNWTLSSQSENQKGY